MSVRRIRVNGKQTASPSTSVYRTAPVPPAPAAEGPDGTSLVSVSHRAPLGAGSPSATVNDLLPGSTSMGMRPENQSDQSVTNTAGASAVTGVAAPISAGSAREKERGASSVREILRRKEEEVKQMLAPEKDMPEMEVLVGKILTEVKAFESRGGSRGAENSEYTYLVAAETNTQFHCPVCGNREQSYFTLDAKQGDTICLGADGQGCGTVVQDHKVHEGSMYRKFEGEADRSHHGPAPNRLYSTAHNMRTWISEGKDASKLRNLAENVEMGLSTVGKDERKTRTAYKDHMKREAFDLINHIAGNCDLHEVVTVRSKELFAGWRNLKEHVHQKNAVICACIIGAHREIGKDELSTILRRRQLEVGVGSEGDEMSRNRGSKLFKDMAKQINLWEMWYEVQPLDILDLLYPFMCSHCNARFNAAKALEFHIKEFHQSAKKPVVELGAGGPSTPYSEWSLADARIWLASLMEALKLPAEHVQSVCAAVEKSLNSQSQGPRIGMKRKATRTAGQALMMLSLTALTNLCGAGPAEKLHHEISRKRGEKFRMSKKRVADFNAAQRKNQIVRKPWVAHVHAELKTAASNVP